jgi:hypothetical protein
MQRAPERRFGLWVLVLVLVGMFCVASTAAAAAWAAAAPNVAPALRVSRGVISWSAQRGATSFHGAISTHVRGSSDRSTLYRVLGLVTRWAPPAPACGQTLYYGVASEGHAREQWTPREISLTGPACRKPPSSLSVDRYLGATPARLGHTFNFGPAAQPLLEFAGSWVSDCDDGTSGGCSFPSPIERRGACQDVVAVLNWLDPHSAPRWAVDGFECYAVTRTGRFVAVADEQLLPRGTISALREYTAQMFPFALPVPNDVG